MSSDIGYLQNKIRELQDKIEILKSKIDKETTKNEERINNFEKELFNRIEKKLLNEVLVDILNKFESDKKSLINEIRISLAKWRDEVSKKVGQDTSESLKHILDLQNDFIKITKEDMKTLLYENSAIICILNNKKIIGREELINFSRKIIKDDKKRNEKQKFKDVELAENWLKNEINEAK